MSNRGSILLLVALLAGAADIMAMDGGSTDGILSLLPDPRELQGWALVDSARIFQGADLYRYIDGGADLFMEYGFRQVAVARYRRAGLIDVEIFEMSDSGAAFGIYSVRCGEHASAVEVGHEGCAGDSYVMFWKGNYYVTVSATDAGDGLAGDLIELARTVDRKILQGNGKPPIMGFLPPQYLLRTAYVRGALGLSAFRQLNAAARCRPTEGAAGVYGNGAVLILRCQTTSEASAGLRSLDSTFSSSPPVLIVSIF